MNITSSPEVFPFQCADCKQDIFILKVAKNEDNTISLLVSCGNQECIEKKRLVLNASSDDLIICEEFDITGHYEDFMTKCTPSTLN
jgi:hypothetical protein